MAADRREEHLVRAMALLGTCAQRFPYGGDADTIADARRGYDEVERGAGPGDAETAATVAIGRSMAAVLELRLCIDDLELNNSARDWDQDGPPLGGMDEDDEDGVSRPFAERAAAAARAALDADPDDPLVPFDLGHVLAWSGDRDGAVAAYEEALRRDPWDIAARELLEELGAGPGEHPSHSDPVNRRRYGFAVLREEGRTGNSEWLEEHWVYGSVAEARADADAVTGSGIDGLDRDELDDHLRLTLEIHRPGRPIAEYDLMARIPAEPDGGPLRIDWSGVPVDEPLEPPLPPGRPLRMDARTCFHGAG
ncbi:hypothetical protein ACFO4E_15090 [Nocardiopsis mangrovi]|uniref:Tetratricopeptide repeat protein n=1 Tax=Nocardiopsis mangrovi TaxID=1179818 RepID=A0ABV9E0T3_9ACTN